MTWHFIYKKVSCHTHLCMHKHALLHKYMHIPKSVCIFLTQHTALGKCAHIVCTPLYAHNTCTPLYAHNTCTPLYAHNTCTPLYAHNACTPLYAQTHTPTQIYAHTQECLHNLLLTQHTALLGKCAHLCMHKHTLLHKYMHIPKSVCIIYC